MQDFLQYFLILVVAFILLIIALALTGNSKQFVKQTSGSNAILDSSAQEIIFSGPNTGPSAFIMRPRPKGSIVRIWNQSANDVEIRNNNLDSGANVVAIGTSLTGLLASNKTIRCFNQDGQSQGTLGTGSWLCQEDKSFA